MVSYMATPGCEKFISSKSEELDEYVIFNNVCKVFGQPNSIKVIMNNKNQKREYVIIRQVTMALLVLKLGFTLERAGAFFGGKDHATAMWAIKTVQNLLDTDKYFRKTVSELFKGIKFREKRPYNKK